MFSGKSKGTIGKKTIMSCFTEYTCRAKKESGYELTGPILESKGMCAIFQKKCKSKKGQNIWKFRQKFTKFENILKKNRWSPSIMVRNKLLEKALVNKFIL